MHRFKNCPFCGGNKIEFIFRKGSGELHEYSYADVFCRTADCGCEKHFVLYDSDEWDVERAKEFCSKSWNKRVHLL